MNIKPGQPKRKDSKQPSQKADIALRAKGQTPQIEQKKINVQI